MRYSANKKVSRWRHTNANANGIRTKNNMSPSPSAGDIIMSDYFRMVFM